MSPEVKPTISFALSLAAGLLILLGGGMTMMWLSGGPAYMHGYGGMMGGYWMMGGVSPSSWSWGLPFVGLISGTVVLLGALMLYSQPGRASSWGAIVLAFSVLSIYGMGGFFVGAILGLVGGILAILWKPGSIPNAS